MVLQLQNAFICATKKPHCKELSLSGAKGILTKTRLGTNIRFMLEKQSTLNYCKHGINFGLAQVGHVIS